MKKKNRLILVMLFAVLIFIEISPFAEANKNDKTLMLPVSVQIMGNYSSPTPSAMFELTAFDDAPLPEGADGTVYRFEMKGNSSRSLKFTFSQTGIWRYHLAAKGLNGDVSPSDLTINVQVSAKDIMVTAKDAQDRKCGLDFIIKAKPDSPDKPDTGDHGHAEWYLAGAGASLLLVLLAVLAMGTRMKD